MCTCGLHAGPALAAGAGWGQAGCHLVTVRSLSSFSGAVHLKPCACTDHSLVSARAVLGCPHCPSCSCCPSLWTRVFQDGRQAPDNAAAVVGNARLSVSVVCPRQLEKAASRRGQGGRMSWGLPVSQRTWVVAWGRRQVGASADTDCLSSGGSPSRFRRWSPSRARSRLLPGRKVGPGCRAALGLVI